MTENIGLDVDKESYLGPLTLTHDIQRVLLPGVPMGQEK
jgi:hypothetical protein